MGDKAIALDLGGTKIGLSVIDRSYEIITQDRLPTPPTAPEIFQALDAAVRGLLASYPTIAGIGIGVAGLVDHVSGTIVAAPNLPIEGQPLKEHLKAVFNLDCRIDNDANLAILGERHCGVGRETPNFIGLTVGTGVGGGIIADGRLWRGTKGAAAEFGHMIVADGGPRCGCGSHGCLEVMASGRAIERLAKEAVLARPGSSLAARLGSEPITGVAVAQAAGDGDLEARGVLSEVGRWLGIGIGNLINVFDPEMVVVGGGAARSIKLVFDRVCEAAVLTAVDPRSANIPIVVSELGNEAALLGAAALVFE